MGEQNNFTRRMFIKGIATSFGALPVFAWPRWAQAFYYNLGFFKKGQNSATYVEDVFSTYLYTGAASTGTLPFVNGINLTQGGLVWLKERSNIGFGHYFFDTARGTGGKYLTSSTTAAEATDADTLTVFNNNGWTIGRAGLSNNTGINSTGATYTSWTFRKAAKFFDVVTFTTSATTNTNQRISHALGSTPGVIILKATGLASAWPVWHRSVSAGGGGDKYLTLNTTNPTTVHTEAVWGTSDPTATDFGINTNFFSTNNTYVAYLFAHDAAVDGIIQCGGFTTDASGNATVSLGWEPQFVIYKYVGSGTAVGWTMLDTTRGWINSTTTNSDMQLFANSSIAESSGNHGHPTATGFAFTNADLAANQNLVYLAIRRGLMKTPTDATKVFTPIAHTSTGISINVSTSFPVDCLIIACRTMAYGKFVFHDRLRGADKYLVTYSSGAEASASTYSVTVKMDRSDGVSITDNNFSWGGNSGQTYVYLALRRAPGFFDQVCYTGDGTTSRQISHSLTATPGMVILKRRSTADHWYVLHQSLNYAAQETLAVNLTNAKFTGNYFGATPQITDTYFTVGTVAGAVTADDGRCNASGETYVAYLFGNCPGVSKCGSFTGNGTSQTINCGFAAGVRFILIKRTDAVGDWYAWDSARGIGAATDPHLSLNSSAVEVTTDDSIDPDNSGFIVNQVAATNINVSGATYIFMAIA